MNRVFLLVLSLMITFKAWSQDSAVPQVPPTAVVHKIIGVAIFDGKTLKTGDLIEKSGLLETKEKSLIQIKIAKWNNSISVGPSSKMVLDLAGEKKYTFEQGICRWRTDIRNALKEGAKGKLFTKNVAMGVRGTDFLVKRLPLLGETEIIMLDGEVLLDNLEDPTNSVLVKKGQWGGLGGRFGKTIAPPIELPAAALAAFEQTIEAP